MAVFSAAEDLFIKYTWHNGTDVHQNLPKTTENSVIISDGDKTFENLFTC